MSLLDHAIWWHVYPLGAFGAPIRDRAQDDQPKHRLRQLIDWLDYAVELGCSGLLLGPVFDSTSHGYDTLDHFRIDPRLGDEADFAELVAQAKQRGLSILLDGVFNHLGVEHRLVRQAVEIGVGPVRTHELGGGRGVEPWEGHADLALLDHWHPDSLELVTEVMLHWLRQGIAGWRLDVAYAVPSEFWRQVTDQVRREFPDAVFLGEVIHGDYPGLAGAGGLDSVTQYELWKGIGSSIADANFWELAWALERHQDFSAAAAASGAVMQTFIGNHDVDRIASRVGDSGAVLALAVLLTVPGMPSLYYGDEQGFRGRKGTGPAADDPLRPSLPPTPGSLSASGWWLYRLHQELIGLRRRHPWLIRGQLAVLDKSNTEIRYQVSDSGQTIEVQLRLEPTSQVKVSSQGDCLFEWSPR